MLWEMTKDQVFAMVGAMSARYEAQNEAMEEARKKGSSGSDSDAPDISTMGASDLAKFGIKS